MKTLAIDLGNTRLKAASFEGRTLQNELLGAENTLGELQKFHKKTAPAASILAHSGHLEEDFAEWAHKENVLMLRHSTPLPIRIDYDTPETLGLDRIANAVAGHAFYATQKAPCLVIDLGTCITYDFVDAGGVFRGGAIAPGWGMRLEAMHNLTANLPLVERLATNFTPQKSTETCLQVGAFMGMTMEIDGTIEHYRKENKNLVVVITGGDASHFEKALKYRTFAHQNLTLLGLNEILLHNN